MAYTSIRFEMDGPLGILTLDRPASLNAISGAMVREIRDVIEARAREEGARALLITGEGRAFSAGADLTDPEVVRPEILEDEFNPLARSLAALDIPIVTAVNGAAVGVGCSIALMSDIVIAAKSAYFLQAFVKVGLAPDGGASWTLPRLIGSGRARAMMMLGERIPAEQAAEWGMIYRCVEDEELGSLSASVARSLASGPTGALGIIRQGLSQSLDQSFEEALDREVLDQRAASQKADHKEALAAFIERRPPQFTGS